MIGGGQGGLIECDKIICKDERFNEFASWACVEFHRRLFELRSPAKSAERKLWPARGASIWSGMRVSVYVLQGGESREMPAKCFCLLLRSFLQPCQVTTIDK